MILQPLFRSLLSIVVLAALPSIALGNTSALDSGLVAWWRFDDSTARDYSGTGNDGMLYGNPAMTAGVTGAAIRFDGFDDYVRIPASPSLHPLRRMTLSYWIKFHNNGSTVGNSIGNGSDDQPYEPGFYTYTGYSEISHFLGLQPNASGYRLAYDATRPLDSQQYVHVVFAVTDDSLYVYRNGCSIGSVARNGWPITRDYDWFIGWSGDYFGDGSFLDGMIDEVRIYDRALSPAEIVELHSADGGTHRVRSALPALSFGTLRCTRDTTIPLDVSNGSIEQIAMSPRLKNGTAFFLQGTSPIPVAPGATATIRVRFQSEIEGLHLDTLLVDDGGCIGAKEIPLTAFVEACPAGHRVWLDSSSATPGTIATLTCHVRPPINTGEYVTGFRLLLKVDPDALVPESIRFTSNVPDGGTITMTRTVDGTIEVIGSTPAPIAGDSLFSIDLRGLLTGSPLNPVPIDVAALSGIGVVTSQGDGLVRLFGCEVGSDLRFARLARIVSIKPNPASTSVVVGYHAPEGTYPRLRMIDLLGRPYDRATLDPSSGANQETSLDVSDLQPGIYTLELSVGTTRSRHRIVVGR